MLKKLFLDLGYTEEEFEIIINNEIISEYKEETLLIKVKENFQFLLDSVIVNLM